MSIQTSRARKILEHAITAPAAEVTATGRRLAKQSMSTQWLGAVDNLRQHMVDTGVVLDEPMFTTPLQPTAPISHLQTGYSGFGASPLASAKKAVKPVVTIAGYLALAYGAYRLIAYAYKQTVGKKKPQRKTLPGRPLRLKSRAW